MAKKKPSDTGLDNLPGCAAQFIKLLIRKMHYYSRKARRDVQAELAAHFSDGLKECQTNEKREQTAQQLIADFGDVRLLAVLLRRAKKRCRPMWKKAIIRGLQAAAAIVILFCLYTVWFITGKPIISVDYLALLNEMSRPEVRDADNAWLDYEKACSLYVAPVPGGVVEEFLYYRDRPAQLEKVLRFADLSGDHQAQILQRIQQNRKHWDNLSDKQQAVILECLNYNWVPMFEKPHLVYSVIPFDSMVTHVVEAIKQERSVTGSIHTAFVKPEQSGFPDVELIDWIKRGEVPTNYMEAITVAVLNEWMKRYRDLPRSAWAPLTDAEYEYLSSWIKKNERAWKHFVAASLKPYCYREYKYDPNDQDKWFFSILLPQVDTLRKLVMLGRWQSRTDRHQGQMQQALEDCLALARVARHWQGKGTLVEQLVGVAISALAHSEILYVTQAEKLSANQLNQLQQQLSEIYGDGYPLMNMEGERLAFLDTVQHVFSDGGIGGGHLLPRRLIWLEHVDGSSYAGVTEAGIMMPFFAVRGMVHARRDETVAEGNKLYAQLCKVTEMSPYQRRVQQVDNEEDLLSALPYHKYYLIHYLAPAASRVSEITYRGKATLEATLTVLALKRWGAEKGEYPPALGDLVAAGYLKKLPMDPFSDKPLVYRRTDGEFILYSLGLNFTDEGGEPGKDRKGRPRMWSNDDDAVFWPLARPEIGQGA